MSFFQKKFPALTGLQQVPNGVDQGTLNNYKQFAKMAEKNSLILLVAGVALAILGLIVSPGGFSLYFIAIPCLYFGKNGWTVAENIKAMAKNKKFVDAHFIHNKINRQKIRKEISKNTHYFNYFIKKTVDTLSPRLVKQEPVHA